MLNGQYSDWQFNPSSFKSKIPHFKKSYYKEFMQNKKKISFFF